MAPRYRRVAVVGAGPFGLAAVHALAAERVFDTIRVFDRRPVLGPRQQRRCRSHAVLRTRPFPVANSPTSIARFQAQPVVVALGHYHVPLLPDIPGLMATARQFPGRFEHAKSYGKADKYADRISADSLRHRYYRLANEKKKRVLVVGGNVSASDLVQDLHRIVQGPLELSMRGRNPALASVYALPNVVVRPTIRSIGTIAADDGDTDDKTSIEVVFDDGTAVAGLDYILFATGYRLHTFSMWDDPSLTLEPDFAPYYDWLVDFAGPPAVGSDTYALPWWRERVGGARARAPGAQGQALEGVD